MSGQQSIGVHQGITERGGQEAITDASTDERAPSTAAMARARLSDLRVVFSRGLASERSESGCHKSIFLEIGIAIVFDLSILEISVEIRYSRSFTVSGFHRKPDVLV